MSGLRQALRRALAEAGVPEPAPEANLLLGHALGLPQTALLARLNDPVPLQAADRLAPLLARRLGREPLAYILGRWGFYGLELAVDRRALIPRPETELLVEQGLEFLARLQSPAPLAADIGTGGGAVALALARHCPRAKVYAVDSSAEALALAAVNCRQHSLAAQVILLEGDLTAPLPEPVHLLLANLPYVKDADWDALEPEVRCYEPETALRGGPDGLAVLRRFMAMASDKLLPGGAVMLEFGAGQRDAVLALARYHFPAAAHTVWPDLAGRPRALGMFLPPQPVMVGAT
ncbi:MAG: peptide chain release factor N(5)-glutamine methyltransferase [Chloroflexi bacterium]|nr:peptide chain release factor N(5)-glutamine methyltransferase [Chloroflexota bacterium]